MDRVATLGMGNVLPDRAANTRESIDVSRRRVNVELLRPIGAQEWIIHGSIRAGEQQVTRLIKEAAKARLLAALWSRYRSNKPADNGLYPTPQGPLPRLDTTDGASRKPRLSVGGRRGPSISFTHLAGRTWAAMSTGSCCVGIDATRGAEFVPPYPFDKVFHKEELEYARAVTRDDREVAAAFLWSCKEAVVKAMGCGLSFLEPLHLVVGPWAEAEASGVFRVDPVGAARSRFPLMSIRPVPVTVFRDESTWLSIAVVEPVQTLKSAPR
ncbi:MAG: 4'-phosphopantetheinyl transferase superfamily protein [Deltaproteobacteria bacterium]